MRSLGLPLALGLALAACSRGGPLEGLKPNPKIVVGHTFSAVEGSLKVVAVMPFYPQPDLRFKLGSAEAAEALQDSFSAGVPLVVYQPISAHAPVVAASLVAPTYVEPGRSSAAPGAGHPAPTGGGGALPGRALGLSPGSEGP